MIDEKTDASDVIVSCRIRLARNIAEFPFVSTCSDLQTREIEETVGAGLSQVRAYRPLPLVNSTELDALERQFLLDLQGVQCGMQNPLKADSRDGEIEVGKVAEVTSQFNVSNQSTQTQVRPEFERASVTINEEDHVRITVTRNDFDLQAAWNQISQLDDDCEQFLNFAFSPRWGYLTASPANVGTGMRVSVLLHLPALVKTSQTEKAFRSLQRMNVVARGVFGESAVGDFFRLGNQATLGRSEEALVEQVAQIVPSLVKFERQAREFLLNENGEGVRREVAEALERLCQPDSRDASSQGREQLLALLSQVRMGVGMGLVGTAETNRVEKLFVLVQLRHHLEVAIAREDYLHATRLRDWIQRLEAGDLHHGETE